MARNNPKPAEKPDWIPDDTTNIVAPSAGRKTSGWTYLVKPPAQNFNWLSNLLSRFVDYFSAQVEDWIVIDSDIDEGDYATLAAYLADAPATDDKILIKEDQTITAQMVWPSNITVKPLDGARLLCATNIATSVLQLSSNIVIEGMLEIILSHTGTTAKAVEVNGDNVTGRINVENSSTGTLTTAYHINANKTGNDIKGFLRNTGGGAVTNPWVDNSTELSNLLMVFNELDNTVRTNGAGLVDLYNDQIINGPKTLTGITKISSASPILQFNETDAGINVKNWELMADGGIFRGRALDDDFLNPVNFLFMTRSGTTVSLINLITTSLQLNGVDIPTISSADIFTNKELGSGTKISLGSDADGDIYYRSGGILARRAKGTDGQVLQLESGLPVWRSIVQDTWSTVSTVQTGTTTIPFDNTIPTNTEGDEYTTVTLTPKRIGNTLLVTALILVSPSVTATVAATLFIDSGASSVQTAFKTISGGSSDQLLLIYRHPIVSLSAITFRLRAGMSTAGTLTVNGVGGTSYYGLSSASHILVQEGLNI